MTIVTTYRARFPNRLVIGVPRTPGNQRIDFNASRNIIFLDARSLFLLLSASSMGHAVQGFDGIIRLATPLTDGNIKGLVNGE
jgi:hypothetical protein